MADGMETMPLVRLVDDSAELLESLAFMLALEGYRTAGFESAEAFLASGDLESPGCAVLDVRMPGMSGLELQREMAARGSPLPVIFLTGHGDLEMAVGAMREGAFDFEEKPVDPEKFLPRIAAACEADRAKRMGARPIGEEVDLASALTEREAMILRAVARGLTSRMIAERFGISRRTAEHHRAAAQAKIGLAAPAAIAAFFQRVDAWKAGHGL